MHHDEPPAPPGRARGLPGFAASSATARRLSVCPSRGRSPRDRATRKELAEEGHQRGTRWRGHRARRVRRASRGLPGLHGPGARALRGAGLARPRSGTRPGGSTSTAPRWPRPSIGWREAARRSASTTAPLWRAANEAYALEAARAPGVDLAETYFNSVTRRVLSTTGVDSTIQFVQPVVDESRPAASRPVLRSCPRRQRHGGDGGAAARPPPPRRRLPGPGPRRHAGRRASSTPRTRRPSSRSPTARSLFFRNKGAYVIGRVPPGGGRDAPPGDRARQPARPGDGGRGAAHRGRGQRRLQLHALLLLRRDRAAARAGGLPALAHAAQARLRALRRDRPQQARQDRALPRAARATSRAPTIASRSPPGSGAW